MSQCSRSMVPFASRTSTEGAPNFGVFLLALTVFCPASTRYDVGRLCAVRSPSATVLPIVSTARRKGWQSRRA